MAKNTGKGGRKGYIINRLQKLNPRTKSYDKYDNDGNFIKAKLTRGPFKNIRQKQK